MMDITRQNTKCISYVDNFSLNQIFHNLVKKKASQANKVEPFNDA